MSPLPGPVLRVNPKKFHITIHLNSKTSCMGTCVVSPGCSTDLESPAQGLSGKIVRSHNGQLEAPFFWDCRFLGGLGNSLGGLVKRRAPYGLACSVSMVHCHRALELVCQYVCMYMHARASPPALGCFHTRSVAE